MSDGTTNLYGRQMVPSGAPDGHTVPVHGPGASEAAGRRFDRQREDERRRDEHRSEVRRREDAEHERTRAAAKSAREREQRAAALAATAERRAEVERDCRRRGVPDHQIGAVVDRVMLDYHVEQAAAAAAGGPAVEQELKSYFRSRPAPSVE